MADNFQPFFGGGALDGSVAATVTSPGNPSPNIIKLGDAWDIKAKVHVEGGMSPANPPQDAATEWLVEAFVESLGVGTEGKAGDARVLTNLAAVAVPPGPVPGFDWTLPTITVAGPFLSNSGVYRLVVVATSVLRGTSTLTPEIGRASCRERV